MLETGLDLTADVLLLKLHVRQIVEARCGRDFTAAMDQCLSACDAMARKIADLEQQLGDTRPNTK